MAGTVWYSSPLTCANCGSVVGRSNHQLFTPSLSPEVGSIWLGVGELLDVVEPDLTEEFPPTPRWPHPGPMRVLEVWQCPVCDTTQGVVLTFADEEPQGWRLVEQRAQLLDRATLAGVDGISRMLRLTLGEPANPADL